MRGSDHQQADIYSYISAEARVRADHPLRAIRTMADQALENMSSRFDAMYAKTGRPSIAPEELLRAQLIQMLYSIRSERIRFAASHLNRKSVWNLAAITTVKMHDAKSLPMLHARAAIDRGKRKAGKVVGVGPIV
jgi:hypothetical protein